MHQVPPARPVFPAEDRARIAELIDRALTTGSLTLGQCTQEFESAVAATVGLPFAVAVASGTAALEIVLRSIGVEGKEVIVPTNTFFATAAAVLHAGGTVRFADVAADTLALSPETLEAALTPQTAGVVLVHIGGTVTPDVEGIAKLCEQRELFLVEDAAHAHGATHDGRAAGSFGAAGTFSFYPTKVVTSGEGGMIVTADERLRDEALIHRDQGKASFVGGDHVRLGYAWRMSELHAAVGLVQWARLDQFLATRRSVAAIYDDALADLPGITPLPPARDEANYYKYIALLDPGIDRVALKLALKQEHGVSMSGEVYAAPLHRQPVFMASADGASADGALPVADDVCRRHVCLPVHSDMTEEEATQVISALRDQLHAVRTR
jgi:dTDP-4-amino-4,6-dideoxygalactose transaminase